MSDYGCNEDVGRLIEITTYKGNNWDGNYQDIIESATFYDSDTHDGGYEYKMKLVKHWIHKDTDKFRIVYAAYEYDG